MPDNKKMQEVERVRVFGIPVDILTMLRSVAYIEDLIQQGVTGAYILAVNPEKVIALQSDSLLKKMFEKAALLLPDGIGVVLAVRWIYKKKIERVPGADLMQRICKEAAEKGYRIFIYGAQEEVSRKAVEVLQVRYPGINIVGRCNGYLVEDRMDELIDTINKLGAEILFIALGSPKQEQWVQQYLPRLNVNVCQGIGGTLDTIAGNVKRAPVFYQRAGLEWFYRLLREPKRIRRQIFLPLFVWNVLKQKITGKE